MARDIVLTSMHGKEFGLSSSKAILVRENGSTGYYNALVQSTANHVQNTVGRLAGTVSTADVVGTTLTNFGLSVLSSATGATAVTFTMAAPAAGVGKEITVVCTASEITVQGTATTILFGATGGDKLFISGADNRSKSWVLRGQTTSRWAVLTIPAGGSITGG